MQQNACLLLRRAPFIARSRPLARLPRNALQTWPRQCGRHRLQLRCVSHRAGEGLHLGDLAVAHLGGRHYFRVNIPDEHQAGDTNEWLKALDTCLPLHLRQKDSALSEDYTNESMATRRDLALLLIQAQRDAGLNVLEHLAVERGRWDAVAWMVQAIAQPGLPPDIWTRSSLAAPLQSEDGVVSLDEFTASGKWKLEQTTTAYPISLDQATIDADPRLYDTRLQKGAMGQIWQALGNLIIRSAEDATAAQMIMPHVLSLLATLHHHGIVPESVYREAPSHDMGSVQQPPLLHMLSSKILTALSDAAWDARQATVKDTEKIGRGQYSPWRFGLESPGVRYRASSSELRPEVWLELVLWSCLHGGWVEEGAAIVDRVTHISKDTESAWSLVCWRNILEVSDASPSYSPSFGWREVLDILEGARPEAQPRPSADDKALVMRTVSSEVIAAFIDAMVSRLYVGVGQRGSRIRAVLSHVKQSKRMLAKQNLGLGFATWDVVVQRFTESGGLRLERDFEVMSEILQLVDPFGKEQELDNALVPNSADTIGPPYFAGPSALPLNLLHRMLHAQAASGNLPGTVAAVNALQDFTELNQRRSIEQFFERLKQRPQTSSMAAGQSALFDTGLAAAEYPSFYPQLPVYALSAFLNVAKDMEDPSFHRWIFDSKNAAGPFVSSSMYREAGLAPSLVRFASATDNQDILENVMTYHSELSKQRSAIIPVPILSALVETLIERRKWGSVRTLLNSLIEQDQNNDGKMITWVPRLLPVLIREMLRTESEHNRDDSEDAAHFFTGLVVKCLDMPRSQPGYIESDIIYCNIALLAAVDKGWGRFVRMMRVLPSRSIPIRDGTNAFNLVLQGVLQRRDMQEAKEYWQTWCHSAAYMQRQARKEGSYLQVSRFRRPFEAAMTSSNQRVHLQPARGYAIDLVGRISPDLQTVRLFESAIQREEMYGDPSDLGQVRKWLHEYAMALG